MESKLQAAVESAFGVEDDKFGIDIVMIMSLIQAVMKMIQDCQNKPAAIAERMKSPGMLDEIRLRIAVRRQFDDEQLFGKRKHVNGIVAKLKAKAASMSEAELEECCAEAINGI